MTDPTNQSQKAQTESKSITLELTEATSKYIGVALDHFLNSMYHDGPLTDDQYKEILETKKEIVELF